jgi:hypothetical protein
MGAKAGSAWNFRLPVSVSSSRKAFLVVSVSSSAFLVFSPKAPMLPFVLPCCATAGLEVTGLPAGLAASGRAAADSSSLKVDFSGCFCLSFSVALLTGALALAGSSVPSRVGVAATVGVEGAVTVGEATVPGVSPPFSFARRSALRFFHSASLAARAAFFSSSGSLDAWVLSSRAATELSRSPRARVWPSRTRAGAMSSVAACRRGLCRPCCGCGSCRRVCSGLLGLATCLAVQRVSASGGGPCGHRGGRALPCPSPSLGLCRAGGRRVCCCPGSGRCSGPVTCLCRGVLATSIGRGGAESSDRGRALMNQLVSPWRLAAVLCVLRLPDCVRCVD